MPAPLTEQDYFKAFGLGEKAQDDNAEPAPDGDTQVTGEKSTDQDSEDTGAEVTASSDVDDDYDDADHDDADGLDDPADDADA